MFSDRILMFTDWIAFSLLPISHPGPAALQQPLFPLPGLCFVKSAEVFCISKRQFSRSHFVRKRLIAVLGISSVGLPDGDLGK